MTRTIVNLWQGSEHASGSGYVRVLNILGYIIHATVSGIFKTLDYFFSFWYIKVYLGIFRHCSDIFRHICNSCVTLTYSEPWYFQNLVKHLTLFVSNFRTLFVSEYITLLMSQLLVISCT